VFCLQLAAERAKATKPSSVPAAKNKKRKGDRTAKSYMTITVSSAEAVPAADVVVKVEPEFVAHDYGKASVSSLLQGTFCSLQFSL